MVGVPAPEIFAPMALRQAARSATSGSQAALRITVSPWARAAAMRAVWVPPTVTLSKWMSAPRSPFGALATT